MIDNTRRVAKWSVSIGWLNKYMKITCFDHLSTQTANQENHLVNAKPQMVH